MSTISASTTTTTAYKVTADTTGTLVLQTGSTPTTAATIDASQNVGVNSTGTIRTKLMVSSSNASDTLTVGTASGGFSITNTNNAYGLQFGSLSTGNSWIQSARLDGTATAYNLLLQPGGGSVGIGVTSPSYILDTYDSTGQIRVARNRTTTGDMGGLILSGLNASSSAVSYALVQSNASTVTAGSEAGNLDFYTMRSGLLTLAARIDSGGNFNLNTTGAFGKFCADVGALAFTASNSGSSLTWGTSSTSGRPAITVASTGSGQDAAFRTVVSPDNGSTWLGWTNGINIETGSNTLSWCINGSANPGRVFSSGGVAMRLTTGGALSTSTGSLGTISDIRMKKDVVDATPKLDQLMQLRVVNYVLIDDPEERKLLGFVAQEVEQVFAGLIEEHDILDPDTKEVTMHQKTVKTTVLIPMLVKAMQEQQAIIETLTNRITALEAK